MPFSASPRLADLPPPPPGKRGWPWTEETPPAAPGGIEAWPSITIVTPSFNQAAFVEATLRSVLLQGYPRLEYLVMDGGSTDGSVEIIRRYERWLAGWVSEKDRGQSHAINKGFARAVGEVVAWLNSDDRLMPGALQSVARAVLARRDAAAWVGAARSVTPSGRLIYVNEPRGLELPSLADWGGTGGFVQPAAFFSRAAVVRAGPLDERLHFAFDLDFFLRLAEHGPLVGTREVWAEETIHSGAKTNAQRGRSLAEAHIVQIRRGFEDVAQRQMAAELQEWDVLKRGTLAERAKLQVNLALRPLLERLRPGR
jgi:glycosyltransferase involved in cell wall biosynthesis